MSDKSAKEAFARLRRKKIIRDKVEGSDTPEKAERWLMVDAQWDENEMQRMEGGKKAQKGRDDGCHTWGLFYCGVFHGDRCSYGMVGSEERCGGGVVNGSDHRISFRKMLGAPDFLMVRQYDRPIGLLFVPCGRFLFTTSRHAVAWDVVP